MTLSTFEYILKNISWVMALYKFWHFPLQAKYKKKAIEARAFKLYEYIGIDE